MSCFGCCVTRFSALHNWSMMRTRFLKVVPVGITVAALLSACTGSLAGSGRPSTQSLPPAAPATSAQPPTLSANPATSEPASAPSIGCSTPLVEQAEGPFYTPGAPERTDITDEYTVGIPLLLTGRVLTADCTPVVGTVIDFWQADGAGVYDNEGYALRGSQVTAADGGYTLETVIPGRYPGRTEHIHVKVTGPDGVVHTTQLYFPDVPRNDEDGIFSPDMVVTVTEHSDDAMVATFDFVLP